MCKEDKQLDFCEKEEQEINNICSNLTDTIDITIQSQKVMEIRFTLSEESKYDLGTKEDWSAFLGQVIQSKVEELLWKNSLN